MPFPALRAVATVAATFATCVLGRKVAHALSTNPHHERTHAPATRPKTTFRIAVATGAKKSQELVNEIIAAGTRRGHTIRHVDVDALDTPDSAPWDMILQKVPAAHVRAIEAYEAAHPACVVLDPLQSRDVLLCREALAKKLDSITLPPNLKTPRATLLDKDDTSRDSPAIAALPDARARQLARIEAAGFTFPMICKPLLAAGSPHSHTISLVLDARALLELPGSRLFCQQFHNHGGVIFKVYIVGDYYYVEARPSVRDLDPAHDPPLLTFDSHNMTDPALFQPLPPQHDIVFPPAEQIQAASLALQRGLNLSLLGVDLIRDSATGELHIVDINYFPSYTKDKALAPGIGDRFIDHFTRVLSSRACDN